MISVWQNFSDLVTARAMQCILNCHLFMEALGRLYSSRGSYSKINLECTIEVAIVTAVLVSMQERRRQSPGICLWANQAFESWEIWDSKFNTGHCLNYNYLSNHPSIWTTCASQKALRRYINLSIVYKRPSITPTTLPTTNAVLEQELKLKLDEIIFCYRSREQIFTIERQTFSIACGLLMFISTVMLSLSNASISSSPLQAPKTH